MHNQNEEKPIRFGLCDEPDFCDTFDQDDIIFNDSDDYDLDLSDVSDEKTVMD